MGVLTLRQTMRELNHEFSPQGDGNVVSLEFNLLYRWHATSSAADTEWLEGLFGKLMGTEDFANVSFFHRAMSLIADVHLAHGRRLPQGVVQVCREHARRRPDVDVRRVRASPLVMILNAVLTSVCAVCSAARTDGSTMVSTSSARKAVRLFNLVVDACSCPCKDPAGRDRAARKRVQGTRDSRGDACDRDYGHHAGSRVGDLFGWCACLVS